MYLIRGITSFNDPGMKKGLTYPPILKHLITKHMSDLQRNPGESLGDFAKRKAAAKLAAKQGNTGGAARGANEGVVFDGIVTEVSPTKKTKTNGSVYQVCGVAVKNAAGQEVIVPAFRTILKVQDANGIPLAVPEESAPVAEGEAVKVYGRIGDDGKKYFDIGSGGVQTSEQALIDGLF